MLKNTLIMVVDGIAICATRRRLDDGRTLFDYGCTTCLDSKSQWLLICDLTQHGMFEDKVKTVVECNCCHSQFFFEYMVATFAVTVGGDGDDS